MLIENYLRSLLANVGTLKAGNLSVIAKVSSSGRDNVIGMVVLSVGASEPLARTGDCAALATNPVAPRLKDPWEARGCLCAHAV
jgi:hypothetical protein